MLTIIINVDDINKQVCISLSKIGLADDTICRLCGHHDESSKHILCECPALSARRFMTFGKFFFEPKDMGDVKLIPSFTKHLKIDFQCKTHNLIYKFVILIQYNRIQLFFQYFTSINQSIYTCNFTYFNFVLFYLTSNMKYV